MYTTIFFETNKRIEKHDIIHISYTGSIYIHTCYEFGCQLFQAASPLESATDSLIRLNSGRNRYAHGHNWALRDSAVPATLLVTQDPWRWDQQGRSITPQVRAGLTRRGGRRVAGMLKRVHDRVQGLLMVCDDQLMVIVIIGNNSREYDDCDDDG